MGLAIVRDQDNDLDNQLSIWLVFHLTHYRAAVYLPGISWFGVTLMGVVLGSLLYPQGQRDFVLPDKDDASIVRLPLALGLQTPPIHLPHQTDSFTSLNPHAVFRFAGR